MAAKTRAAYAAAAAIVPPVPPAIGHSYVWHANANGDWNSLGRTPSRLFHRLWSAFSYLNLRSKSAN